MSIAQTNPNVNPDHAAKDGYTPISPATFFAVGYGDAPPGTAACTVTSRGGKPADNHWHRSPNTFADALSGKAKGRTGAYHSLALYRADGDLGIRNGRGAANVAALRVIAVDIEGSEEKYNKAGGADGGYKGIEAVRAALAEFTRATELHFNLTVETGNNGLHAYAVLDRWLPVSEWLPRAQGLKALARAHGFKADPVVTADAARILRSPGSVHAATGREATAFQGRVAPYTLEEFDRLVPPVAVAGHAPADDDIDAVLPRRAKAVPVGGRDVNADIAPNTPPSSLAQVAAHCGAVAQLKDTNGNLPEPHWRAVIGIAKFCPEDGEALVHEWSSGYAGYSYDETQRKLDAWGTGPSTCDHFGNTSKACQACPHRGRIKSPIVLGRPSVSTSAAQAPGSAATTVAVGAAVVAPDPNMPDYVVKMNQRYAQVRLGGKVVIADFRSSLNGATGVTYGLGYMELAAFHATHAGQFAPPSKPGEKARPLAAAWLQHPQRRQYEAAVFAPGVTLPSNVLPLWQGFAVEPREGDVTSWERVLAAVVTEPATRDYVRKWLAWKIQNPGGVPDTIPVVTGDKGVGKNALFSPILDIFGPHGMLADNPELIAGRFTGHLETKALAVLDESIFCNDPRQADAIKSRVTARTMTFESKGRDPVSGINRCAYVITTNHSHAWQATMDERRAVVIEAGGALRGDLSFWSDYHKWANGPGPAALLYYFQRVDVTDFNPRAIPKSEALRRQVELTALRDPVTAWWHGVLDAGVLGRHHGSTVGGTRLNTDAPTQVPRATLQAAFESGITPGATRSGVQWAAASKKLRMWTGMASVRPRGDGTREYIEVLPPLTELRRRFADATGIQLDDGPEVVQVVQAEENFSS